MIDLLHRYPKQPCDPIWIAEESYLQFGCDSKLPPFSKNVPKIIMSLPLE